MCTQLNYYCRKCGQNTQHEIVSFEHTLPNHNFATLECLKCEAPAFSVQYDKGQEAPLYNSLRVSEVLMDDAQPTDICWP